MSSGPSYPDGCSPFVPKILIEQLVAHLIDNNLRRGNVVTKSNSNDDKSPDKSPSSGSDPCSCIHRLFGILLFIDISGFTTLSQRLNVESFKTHINNYFSKIIDIVVGLDGEVVKFAGDAMYVLWRVIPPLPENLVITPDSESMIIDDINDHMNNINYDPFENKEFWSLVREAAKKAISCGVLINETCSNFRINIDSDLDSDILTATPIKYSDMSTIVTDLSAVPSSPDTSSVYLNVHSGMSMGIMAGVNVSENGRSEYFLVGDVLEKVAKAEKHAEAAGTYVRIVHTVSCTCI